MNLERFIQRVRDVLEEDEPLFIIYRFKNAYDSVNH